LLHPRSRPFVTRPPCSTCPRPPLRMHPAVHASRHALLLGKCKPNSIILHSTLGLGVPILGTPSDFLDRLTWHKPYTKPYDLAPTQLNRPHPCSSQTSPCALLLGPAFFFSRFECPACVAPYNNDCAPVFQGLFPPVLSSPSQV
jgi:hypothetical protein